MRRSKESRTGGCQSELRGTQQNWFNQCALTEPATDFFGPAFGTEGRNAVIGPPFVDLDFALIKSFALGPESHRLEFRGESFNLLNHLNFSDPYHDFEVVACGHEPSNPSTLPYCPTANHGTVLSSNKQGPPRQIQLSFGYIF